MPNTKNGKNLKNEKVKIASGGLGKKKRDSEPGSKIMDVSTESEIQKEKNGHPWTVVFYNTGELQLKEMNETSARIWGQMLPPSVITKYQSFPSKKLAEDFITVTKKSQSTVQATRIVTPQRKLVDKQNKYNFLPQIRNNTSSAIVHGLSTSVSVDSKSTDSASKRAKLAENIRTKCFSRSVGFFIYVGKYKSQNDSEHVASKKVIAIDMRRSNGDDNYWLHKAKAWMTVFEEAREVGLDKELDDIVYDLHYFQYRSKDPKESAENQPLTIIVNQKTPYNLTLGAFYMYVEPECTEDEICSKMYRLIKTFDSDICREAYNIANVNASQAIREGIIAERSGKKEGEYWKTLQSCMRMRPNFIYLDSLDEIFMNEDIDNICKTMFGDNMPNEYEGPIAEFAYGKMIYYQNGSPKLES
jgi:hypothetical protein